MNIDTITAFVSGAAFVKMLEFCYSEYRAHTDNKKSARKIIDDNLVQILKSADEFVGKTCSLAREDFRTFKNLDVTNNNSLNNNDFLSYLYITIKFWVYIEAFKKDGLSVQIGKDKRGKQLQAFLACIESRKIRLVDRITQRALSELMTKLDGDNVIFFVDFVTILEENIYSVGGRDSLNNKWLEDIINLFVNLHKDKVSRQKLLRYGMVVHALIDTLDPNHLVTHDRPSYPNKLSKNSHRDMKYIVFKEYLGFVDIRKFKGLSISNR